MTGLISLKYDPVMITMMMKLIPSKPERDRTFVTYPGDSMKIDVVPITMKMLGSIIEGLVRVCMPLAATMTRL